MVMFENAVKGLALRIRWATVRGHYSHPRRTLRAAGALQLAVYSDHAGIAGFDRAKLRVIADLREMTFGHRTMNGLDEQFPMDGRNGDTVECERNIGALFQRRVEKPFLDCHGNFECLT